MIQVGQFLQLSTVDYPGQLSAVVFCQGCPLRCSYCYNAVLQPRRSDQTIGWVTIMDFLKTRQKLLDAVVFTGGEPTQQSNLLAAIQEVKALGFKIGLHTSGVYPNRLRILLPHIDWVGLDIKTTKEKYDALTGMPHSGELVWQSLKSVLDSGVDYELRTTKCGLDAETEQQIIDQLQEFGKINHVWQPCYTP